MKASTLKQPSRVRRWQPAAATAALRTFFASPKPGSSTTRPARPPRPALPHHARRLAQGEVGALSPDALERLSYVFASTGASDLLPSSAAADAWIASQCGPALQRRQRARSPEGRQGGRSLPRAPIPGCAARWLGLRRSRASPEAQLSPGAQPLPAIQLFERVADPADLEAVIPIESLTNDRLRGRGGEIRLVAPEDRLSAPAPRPSWPPSRTSIPRAGASRTAPTARITRPTLCTRRVRDGPSPRDLPGAHEGGAGRDRHALLSREPERGTGGYPRAAQEAPGALRPDSYASRSRSRGRIAPAGRWHRVGQRAHPGGECAPRQPARLKPAIQGPHLAFVWDGERIASYYEKRGLRR